MILSVAPPPTFFFADFLPYSCLFACLVHRVMAFFYFVGTKGDQVHISTRGEKLRSGAEVIDNTSYSGGTSRNWYIAT